MDSLILHRDTITTEPADQASHPSDQVLSEYWSAGRPSSANEVVESSRPPILPTHHHLQNTDPFKFVFLLAPTLWGGSDVVPSRGEKSSTAPSPSPSLTITKRDLLHYSGGGLRQASTTGRLFLGVNP
jgi:hypothetical protein